MEDIQEEEDLKVEEARAKMYAAEEDYEDVDYGERENQEDLRREYEDALEAEDEKLKEAGRKVQIWRKACIRPWRRWKTLECRMPVQRQGKPPQERCPS